MHFFFFLILESIFNQDCFCLLLVKSLKLQNLLGLCRVRRTTRRPLKFSHSSDYFLTFSVIVICCIFLFFFNRKNFFFIVLLTFVRRFPQRHKSTINFQTHFDMNLNGIFINRKVERKKRLQNDPRTDEDFVEIPEIPEKIPRLPFRKHCKWTDEGHLYSEFQRHKVESGANSTFN